MTVGELNHLMTYVTEGWMLLSMGFIGIEFVSFVSRRIQEDIEADKLALKASQTEEVSVTEAAESAVAQRATQAVSVADVPNSSPDTSLETSMPKSLTPESSPAPKTDFSKSDSGTENASDDAAPEALTEEDEARLEEVAAVSEQLAKTKSKQSDSPSVSVST